MGDPRQPFRQSIIRVCSRALLWIGAAVFLIGGKFLYEIRHVNFAFSETVGIVGGVLLMLLGAGIRLAAKPPRANER
jgi:hypothetical protein